MHEIDAEAVVRIRSRTPGSHHSLRNQNRVGIIEIRVAAFNYNVVLGHRSLRDRRILLSRFEFDSLGTLKSLGQKTRVSVAAAIPLVNVKKLIANRKRYRFMSTAPR